MKKIHLFKWVVIALAVIWIGATGYHKYQLSRIKKLEEEKREVASTPPQAAPKSSVKIDQPEIPQPELGYFPAKAGSVSWFHYGIDDRYAVYAAETVDYKWYRGKGSEPMLILAKPEGNTDPVLYDKSPIGNYLGYEPVFQKGQQEHTVYFVFVKTRGKVPPTEEWFPKAIKRLLQDHPELANRT